MDPFSLFTTTDYTFLKLGSGSGGNKVIQEYPANGIVKLRDGMTQADNVEAYESTSTVHVRPSEAFLATLGKNMVGHGVRVDNVDYRITGQVEGYDYDTGTVQFYKVTLKRESLWQSGLPLE